MARTQASAYTLLGFTVLALLLMVISYVLASTLPYDPADADLSHGPLPMWMVAGFAYGILVLGLIAFYLGHLYTESGLSGGERAMWLFLLVFLNIFAMPFYWLFHVRAGRRERNDTTGHHV